MPKRGFGTTVRSALGRAAVWSALIFTGTINLRWLHGSDDERIWRRIQALRLLRLLLRTAAAGGAAVAFVLCSLALPRPAQSEFDLVRIAQARIQKPFQLQFPADPEALAAIDLRKVHAELFPQWAAALQDASRDNYPGASGQAFSRLLSEAGRDKNLHQILVDLHRCATDDAWAYRGQIREDVAAWNKYLGEQTLPWRIEFSVTPSARGPTLHIRSYKVLADIAVDTAGVPSHLRVLSRVDPSPVREGFLGQTQLNSGESVVLADRLGEFTQLFLWPLFDPLAPAPSSWADRIRQEAATELDATAIDTLARTALAKHQLRDKLIELADRKGCGSTVRVTAVSYQGISDHALAALRRAAAKNAKRRCKRLTGGDVDNIERLSAQLKWDPQLAPALSAAAAWLGRAVAIHEVRHLLDAKFIGSNVDSSAAGATELPEDQRAELSAYVSVLATPGVGYLALYQACHSGAAVSAHDSSALSAIIRNFLPGGCWRDPGPNLYRDARELDNAWYPDRPPAVLAAGFPSDLPID